ncbi:hypothetical protein LIER_38489 [Lithospermum erythrorhizon]|uniref:Vacuolar protein sorting-associated protein 62 n=1 Tax=Lithospermum erythrorhizon TaxID=34254 RepID=A0AAV3Q119_LITER
MLCYKCLHWNRASYIAQPEPDTFSLPAPLPQWPQGSGFASGVINLGELEVREITHFEFIFDCNMSADRKQGASFYKPAGIPSGFFSLGHYCQSNGQPLRGFVLVAREVANTCDPCLSIYSDLPALQSPLDYALVWCSADGGEGNIDGGGFLWLPQPPDGYKALGFVATNSSKKPELDDIRCVRSDLTDQCETYLPIVNTSSTYFQIPLGVWSTRPLCRGMVGKGVSVGSFFCSINKISGSREEVHIIKCLKNVNTNLHAMPNLDHIHALIRHYGPTLFFHPDEKYLPSSVAWFFENGSLLYQRGASAGECVDGKGSNLPSGGSNDGKYWLDLPNDGRRESVQNGNLESAKLYVHVKPASGGTFTDIVMWIFCPFNGPATIKLGLMNFSLSKVGQHVGDWEHFTLRISNFTGELWSIYFSQHSGGEWVDIYDLEFIEGNKAVIYASKSGHASFPHAGTYIQGSSKLGIGIRNDAARSKHFVDSSINYEIIAAEYLGDGVVSEPCWLQFMREWGPTIVYGSRTELDKIINHLPASMRCSIASMCGKLPNELYGEEGPTGPKEKNNWVGDERS